MSHEVYVAFDVLYRLRGQVVAAGSTFTTPVISIARYRLKTVSVVADYAMNVSIEVSDDGANWYKYYSDTLVANGLWARSFEEDFYYLRLKISNPDTADHNIVYLAVKGR